MRPASFRLARSPARMRAASVKAKVKKTKPVENNEENTIVLVEQTKKLVEA